MGREKRLIGARGERIACRFLRRKGHKVVATNVRTPFGEIDMITIHNHFMVFVEVKTRSSPSLGPPFLSVTRQKQLHIIRNALWYLKRYALTDRKWRIDVVSVMLDTSGRMDTVEVLENAVEDIYH